MPFRFLRRFRRTHPFTSLFVSLIGFLVGAPILRELGASPLLDVVFFVAIMSGATIALARDRRQVVVAMVLAVPFLVSYVSALGGGENFRLGAIVWFLPFMGYVTGIALGRVVRAPRVTFDLLLGTASVYLLTGLCFAGVYELIDALLPGAISGSESDASLIFFSLVTLTTLGYGDVLPVHPIARSVAAIEAVIGVFYVALFVSRMVAQLVSREHQERG